MKKIKIFIASVLILIMGCNKTENVSLDGNVVGFITLIDKDGNEVKDKTGVTVRIENTSYSATTNEIGKFELNNIPAGTYNWQFEKEGYGTCKQYQWQFVGGDVPALINKTLYTLPDFTIKNLDKYVYIDYYNMIDFSGTLTKAINRYYVKCFMKRSPDVSCLNYDYSSNAELYNYTSSTDFTYSAYMHGAPFNKGDKIYLALYFYSYYDQTYQYPEKNISVYSTYKKAFDTIEMVW